MDIKQIIIALAILLFLAAAVLYFDNTDTELIKAEDNNMNDKKDMRDENPALEYVAVFVVLIIFAIGLIADKLRKKLEQR